MKHQDGHAGYQSVSHLALKKERETLMRRTLETKSEPGTGIRPLSFGCLSLLFAAAYAAMAGSNAFSKASAGAREVRSLVCWYAESGQWRKDAKAYLAHAEFLFCPNSRTVPSIDSDEDEE
jgi:hypothetical protein